MDEILKKLIQAGLRDAYTGGWNATMDKEDDSLRDKELETIMSKIQLRYSWNVDVLLQKNNESTLWSSIEAQLSIIQRWLVQIDRRLEKAGFEVQE